MNAITATLGGILAALAFMLTSFLGQLQNPTQPTTVLGGQDVASTVATSSIHAAGATATTVFATSTCATRTISTSGVGGAMLTFTDQYTPTSSFGHWQAASTTVAYRGADYGCGEWKVYSSPANTLTVTETQ